MFSPTVEHVKAYHADLLRQRIDGTLSAAASGRRGFSCPAEDMQAVKLALEDAGYAVTPGERRRSHGAFAMVGDTVCFRVTKL